MIPEERIILGELEFTHVVFMDRLRTEYVQSREKPATARGTLVGDPFALYLIGEVSIQIVLALPINGKLVDVVIGDRVTDRLIGRRSLIRLFDLLQHRG